MKGFGAAIKELAKESLVMMELSILLVVVVT